MEKNTTTEEKIKEAARKVFTQKGFAATRTRDIAEESGFNIALLNYYFRSKQKLFDMIMLENMQILIHALGNVIRNPQTTFEQKIETIICYYIDTIKQNPDMPIFVLSEIRRDPQEFINKVGFDNERFDTSMFQQWMQLTKDKKVKDINPLHFIMNIISMTIFPFVCKPIILDRSGLTKDEFNLLMDERKKLIPIWIHDMIFKVENE